MFKLLISTHVRTSLGVAVSSVVVDFTSPQLVEDAVRNLYAVEKQDTTWYTVVRLYRS